MKKTKKIIIIAVAILLVVATIAVVLATRKNASTTEVLRSEHFSVSAAMVTYSLYDTYHYYYNEFGAEMLKVYFGIDANKPLHEQYSDEQKGVTWFDVFKTEAIDGFANSLALCEAALEAGVELNDYDNKYIQAEIDALETLAGKDGMTINEYIENVYGNKVKLDDIKQSREIFRLANKMRYKIYSETDATPDEIKAVVDKEGDTYLQRDVLCFELTLSNDSAKTEQIKAYAKQMKEAKTEEEFRKFAEDFIKTDYCVNIGTGKVVSKNTVQNNVSEDEKTELTSWFFASGTKVGDTYLKEGNAAYTVYMIISDPAMDETLTRDMYTIVFESFAYGTVDECKAKADEIYNKWVADGAKLEDFKALAKQYSTDNFSVASGGYYSNIIKGTMVEELDIWLFADTTAVGAHTVIKTDIGCHIMYYAGEGEPVWKEPVIESIREDKVSSTILGYTEKYPVEQVAGNMKYVKAK